MLTPPHPQVRVKLAEAEGLGALTQGVEGTELAPPAPSSTHTGEERRGIRAGSHFFFVVGKEDVPGATALPGTHMQSSQRRQACEVERLGGGGGQGGRAERERQRARVGRWGLGPEEGRDRAAAAAPGRSKRAGSRLAGGLAEGAGGRSLQAAPGSKNKPASFQILLLRLPTRYSLDSSPSGFSPSKPRERCLPSCRLHIPGASPPRMPEVGEKGSQDGGSRKGETGLLPEGGSRCCPFLQGERFQGWAPGHQGCRGLPVSAAQRVVGTRGRQREMLSVQWGALWVSRSDPQADPSARRAEAEPAAGAGGAYGDRNSKCEGQRGRSAAGGSFGPSWRGTPPQPGATLPRCSPALEVSGQRALHRTPPALCSQPPLRRCGTTILGREAGSQPSPPPHIFSPDLEPASLAGSRNHPPSKHQGPPCLQTYLPLLSYFSCGTDTPDPSLGIQVTGASLGTDFTPLHSSSFTDCFYFPTYLLI